MFILRSVEENDLEDLFELSQMVLFINLPSDKKILEEKIDCSLKSFKHLNKDFSQNHYLFVLEDTDEKKVIGASLIHAQHGTVNEPHYFLKVGKEKKFSETLNTGFIHGTLKFGYETNGPTEIGGLVLNPDYRGHHQKLGKQLSYVRFLYMALHRKLFKEIVHSELMPPLDSEGNSLLWEAIGRHFLNMNYIDADILSRTNKEFILSLFPSETIYVSLLPLAARDLIGKVGPDTKAVKKMLEEIGFKYIQEIDPFDGGPHYRGKLEEITPIKSLREMTLKEETQEKKSSTTFMITLNDDDGNFSAIQVQGRFDSKTNSLFLSHDLLKSIKLNENTKVQGIFMKGGPSEI